MTVAFVIDGDEALISLAFVIDALPRVETRITINDQEWRVTGWDHMRRCFQCERVKTDA